ncbi:DegV family protein [Tumebacillus permanentifrigoris]|uniref:DegV family protein with EDD domain n=1 Tax=Tumebacillus permanentifrigoris TaxID=378543 RepID=A0A316DEN2_9BACL|nr:DegV family protein [Tumebacillus permanentifrigoris]PWK16196.1 DegV family protein with EDD domain [Tumebacillus permanentifrigoris]
MSKIALVTDSAAYVPSDILEKYGITVVPLSVNFGNDSFREGMDISSDQFYERLVKEKSLPTTSQPAVGEFVQTFEKLLKTHDSVLAVLLSSGMSGTANSAETAARMVGGDIAIIDSKITAWGQYALVLEAAKLRDEGLSKGEIVDRLTAMRDKVGAYFVVDSLEHLHRGGRVSGISAMLGSLLQVKPILRVTDGKLEMFEKVRTRKKALARVIELVKAEIPAGEQLVASIVYADNREDGEALRAQVQEALPDAELQTSQLGPVVGTHTGPGLLAVIYYTR